MAAPTLASGGAGAPAAPAKEPLLGTVTVAPENEGLFSDVWKERKADSLGTLSDPSIRYVGKVDARQGKKVSIVFHTVKGDAAGHLIFYFQKGTELYLESIETPEGVRGKGYGTRLMSVVMDIAARAGKPKVTLWSLPTAVSFYLGGNTPFTFNNPENKRKYTKRYTKLMSKGVNHKTAKRNAGKVFQVKHEGVKVNEPVPMTWTKTRKHRRSRKD
jgi:predicted GNAT family acetyltransferase